MALCSFLAQRDACINQSHPRITTESERAAKGTLGKLTPPDCRLSLSHTQVRSNLLATQPFQDTFGPNTKRKKPKLAVDNVAELSMLADERDEK